jgi:hypothetical protein
LILLGVLAIITGIIALAWPGVTILALVILFAIYALIDAGLQAMRAFSSPTAGPVFGHLLLGLVDIAAGVIALVWPGQTALVLVLIVGIWAVTGGFFEIFAAFQHHLRCLADHDGRRSAPDREDPALGHEGRGLSACGGAGACPAPTKPADRGAPARPETRAGRRAHHQARRRQHVRRHSDGQA